MSADRVLPKSLHTVTVFVNVTREIAALTGACDEFALQWTVETLGLAELPDAHGLVSRARYALACAPD